MPVPNKRFYMYDCEYCGEVADCHHRREKVAIANSPIAKAFLKAHEPEDTTPKEIRKEVKTIQVNLQCPECGTALKASGVARATYPAQHRHHCPGNGCSFVTWELQTYPYVDYEIVR